MSRRVRAIVRQTEEGIAAGQGLALLADFHLDVHILVVAAVEPLLRAGDYLQGDKENAVPGVGSRDEIGAAAELKFQLAILDAEIRPCFCRSHPGEITDEGLYPCGQGLVVGQAQDQGQTGCQSPQPPPGNGPCR